MNVTMYLPSQTKDSWHEYLDDLSCNYMKCAKGSVHVFGCGTYVKSAILISCKTWCLKSLLEPYLCPRDSGTWRPNGWTEKNNLLIGPTLDWRIWFIHVSNFYLRVWRQEGKIDEKMRKPLWRDLPRFCTWWPNEKSFLEGTFQIIKKTLRWK